MGKSAKERNAEQLRELRNQERRRALEKKQKEQKIITIISIVIAAIIVVTIGTIVLVNILMRAPQMEDLDFSSRDIADLVETTEVTNYVKLNVSYTDAKGEKKTGDIVLRLFDNVAPISVKNFQEYVKSGFYDGLIFHRVIKDFMIQGGGYDENMKDKATNDAIKGEFAVNGVENNLQHIRGVLSMARTSVNNSATSEFFIVHKDSPHLNSNYAGFGYVVYGMDTVDAIAEQSTNSSDRPINSVIINSARFVTEK